MLIHTLNQTGVYCQIMITQAESLPLSEDLFSSNNLKTNYQAYYRYIGSLAIYYITHCRVIQFCTELSMVTIIASYPCYGIILENIS